MGDVRIYNSPSSFSFPHWVNTDCWKRNIIWTIWTWRTKAKTQGQSREQGLEPATMSLSFLTFLQEPKKIKSKEKEKKGAKSSTTLSKDEETIKRLKVWGFWLDVQGVTNISLSLCWIVFYPRLWCTQGLVKSIPGPRFSTTTDQEAERDSCRPWHDWSNEHGAS